MAKIRLGVIFGGRSGEHEVSIRSTRSVLAELDQSKYEIIQIAISKSGEWYAGEGAIDLIATGNFDGLEQVSLLPIPGDPALYRTKEGDSLQRLYELDVAFPVLHGTFGEDGTLQGLLEMAEIPYVGAGVLASSVAMDKGLFKGVMQANGIPILEFAVLDTSQFQEGLEPALEEAEGVAAYPLFVKPANLGSSVGISKCRNRSDLLEGIMDAARYDRRVIVERGIEAREIEVSVLGNDSPQASIPGEIVPGDEFYSYRAKYIDDTSELLIPAPIDEGVAQKVRNLSIQAYLAIDGAGMARVDFLLEKGTSKIYLNEMNTIPGFTSISMYPKLWEASGLRYADLMDRLVELAIERQAQKAKLERSFEVSL